MMKRFAVWLAAVGLLTTVGLFTFYSDKRQSYNEDLAESLEMSDSVWMEEKTAPAPAQVEDTAPIPIPEGSYFEEVARHNLGHGEVSVDVKVTRPDGGEVVIENYEIINEKDFVASDGSITKFQPTESEEQPEK